MMTPAEMRQASTSALRARLLELGVFFGQIGPVDLALVDEEAVINAELQRRRRSRNILLAGAALLFFGSRFLR